LNPSDAAAAAARIKWLGKARAKQLPPEGDWRTLLILSGRGFGKTKLAAEDCWHYAWRNPGHRIAVIAPTQDDLRKVFFEGESGLQAACPAEILAGGTWDGAYNINLGQVEFANGAIVQGFSAEKPGRLRGPQFHRAYCDELAAWARQQETWDMLQFGLRLGDDPRAIVTTTPKATPLLYALTKDATSRIVKGSTYENKANLAAPFLKKILAYEGTALGRQEIHAELVDLYANAILRPDWWQPWTATPPTPDMILISLDTAYTKDESNDPSACTVWYICQDEDGRQMALLRYAWPKYLEFNDLVEEIEATWRHFGAPGVPCRVLVEAKASGLSVIQELRRRIPDFPVWAELPHGDKVARAHSVTPMFVAGKIYAMATKDADGEVEFKKWARDVIDQCGQFPPPPNATSEDAITGHDDLVDSTTQALRHLRTLGIALMPEDDPPEPTLRSVLRTSRRMYGGIGTRQ
jgi:predicted phage terminase large subunit-like protein